VRLRRYEFDRGLRHLHLHRVDDDLLIRYETGLALISRIHRLAWHVEHGRIDWIFEGIENNVIWLANQEGAKVGYHLGDGGSTSPQ